MQFNGQSMEIINKLQKEVFFFYILDILSQVIAEP